MKISIITATFNSYPHIISALDCIKNQTHDTIEYIIVDGGSKDATIKTITASGIEIKIISEPDKGIYDALNKGIALATGDVIGFLHSDDLFASTNVISEIAAVFQTNQVDGVYGDLQYVNKTNTNTVIRNWKSCDFQPKLLKKGWMPAHPTLFLKKEVYSKHGNFDLGYKIAADYDFMLRILKDDTLKFYFLPKVITKMRVGGASNRSLKNIIQKSKEDYKVIKENKIGLSLLVLALKNISKIPQFFIKH